MTLAVFGDPDIHEHSVSQHTSIIILRTAAFTFQAPKDPQVRAWKLSVKVRERTPGYFDQIIIVRGLGGHLAIDRLNNL